MHKPYTFCAFFYILYKLSHPQPFICYKYNTNQTTSSTINHSSATSTTQTELPHPQSTIHLLQAQHKPNYLILNQSCIIIHHSFKANTGSTVVMMLFNVSCHLFYFSAQLKFTTEFLLFLKCDV